MSGIDYDLLLDLYRGKATAVERISEKNRLQLAINTPLTHFIEEADTSGIPKHVVLTGNAGDGKTFAALSSKAKTFRAIADASAARGGRSRSARWRSWTRTGTR